MFKLKDIDILHFETPKSIVECINDHEDINDHKTIYVLDRISGELRKSQLELIDKYPEYILPKRTLSNGKIEYDPYPDVYYKIPKVMSYPLFAIRNVMTYDWIPGNSFEIIRAIVEEHEHIQKHKFSKKAHQRTGKPIYFSGDAGTKCKMPNRISKLTNDWSSISYKKEANKKKRAIRYDIREQLKC
jgi:hypothetical protein